MTEVARTDYLIIAYISSADGGLVADPGYRAIGQFPTVEEARAEMASLEKRLRKTKKKVRSS